MLIFPSQAIDSSYAPVFVKYFSKMPAIKAIQLIAQTIDLEFFEAIALHTVAKYILMGQHRQQNYEERKRQDELEIMQWCSYNWLSGEYSDTMKNWLGRLPKVPIAQAETVISATGQVATIIDAWGKAENMRFTFNIKGQSNAKELAEAIVKRCKDETHTNEYEIEHDLFNIVIQRMDKAFLPLAGSRKIIMTLKSYKAIGLVAGLLTMDQTTSTASYHVIFPAGFSDGINDKNRINFRPFMTDLTRILQFDELNLFGCYNRQYARGRPSYAEHELVTAISASVDDKLIRNIEVLKELLNSSVQFLLLRGIDGLGSFASGTYRKFTVEPDTQICYDALGQKKPSNEGKVTCLSTQNKNDVIELGENCAKYDFAFILL